jgi:hypothetical protein
MKACATNADRSYLIHCSSSIQLIRDMMSIQAA